MPTCPTCGAEFTSDKLLDIHRKYCRQARPVADPISDSDAGYSTEKLIRSDILGVLGDDPTPTGEPASSPQPPTGRTPDPAVSGDYSPLSVAAGLPTESEGPAQGPADTDIFESARQRLRLTVKPYEGMLLVQVRGDLVVWTSLQLNAAIKKLLATNARMVVLEVSSVEQCDATGLGAILLFNQELKDRGGRLVLAAPTTAREKFETIKGFTRAVDFAPSLEEAVAELRSSAP